MTKKVILIITATPESLTDPKSDPQVIELLTLTNKQPYFQAEVCQQASIEQLIADIAEYQPTIIHFIGHGDEKGLYLEQENNQVALLDNNKLYNIINSLPSSVQAILFNSCQSKTQAESAFQRVPVAIGTTRKISSEESKSYTRRFYTALFNQFNQSENALIPSDIFLKAHRLGCDIFAKNSIAYVIYSIYPAYSKLTTLVEKHDINRADLWELCNNQNYLIRHQLTDKTQNKTAILDSLMEMTTSNNKNLPLLCAIKQLIDQKITSSILKNSLLKWLEAACVFKKIKLTDLKYPIIKPPSSTNEISDHIFICMVPTEHETECYINLWHYSKQQPLVKTMLIDIANTTSIANLIETLLTEVIKRRQTQLNFFLPIKLLSLPVGHWLDQYGESLINHFRIVIRSLERLQQHPRFIGEWREINIDQDILVENCTTYLNHQNLKRKNIRQCDNLALTFTPIKHDFFYLLSKGQSVFLWSRKAPDEKMIVQHFKTDFKQIRYVDLAIHLTDLQDKAIRHNEFNNINHHLCLFWDDPKIVPPQDQRWLASPQTLTAEK